MKEGYRKQVDLLLDVIEIALEDKKVALKGGTAINLFHRDFPRYVSLSQTPFLLT